MSLRIEIKNQGFVLNEAELRASRSTKLHKSEENKTLVDDTRDPERFREVQAFLRTGRVELESDGLITADMVHEEMEYWGIPAAAVAAAHVRSIAATSAHKEAVRYLVDQFPPVRETRDLTSKQVRRMRHMLRTDWGLRDNPCQSVAFFMTCDPTRWIEVTERYNALGNWVNEVKGGRDAFFQSMRMHRWRRHRARVRRGTAAAAAAAAPPDAETSVTTETVHATGMRALLERIGVSTVTTRVIESVPLLHIATDAQDEKEEEEEEEEDPQSLEEVSSDVEGDESAMGTVEEGDVAFTQEEADVLAHLLQIRQENWKGFLQHYRVLCRCLHAAPFQDRVKEEFARNGLRVEFEYVSFPCHSYDPCSAMPEPRYLSMDFPVKVEIALCGDMLQFGAHVQRYEQQDNEIRQNAHKPGWRPKPIPQPPKQPIDRVCTHRVLKMSVVWSIDV